MNRLRLTFIFFAVLYDHLKYCNNYFAFKLGKQVIDNTAEATIGSQGPMAPKIAPSDI